MDELIRRFREFRFKGIIFVLFVFLFVSALLVIELSGVNAIRRAQTPDMLPSDKIVTKEEACLGLDVRALLLRNSNDVSSREAYDDFQVVLSDMKVGYRDVDISADRKSVV